MHKAKTERAFVRSSNDRFLADLYALATAELEQNNVTMFLVVAILAMANRSIFIPIAEQGLWPQCLFDLLKS